jgi:hypothetical protein
MLKQICHGHKPEILGKALGGFIPKDSVKSGFWKQHSSIFH